MLKCHSIAVVIVVDISQNMDFNVFRSTKHIFCLDSWRSIHISKTLKEMLFNKLSINFALLMKTLGMCLHTEFCCTFALLKSKLCFH